MKVLILGMSDIAVRRVLPAFRSLPAIDAVDIASRRAGPGVQGADMLYADYATALERSDADLVYVSLVNSLHFDWARLSLMSGRHTVVDKPACLAHQQTSELLELAERTGVCLAESTVFLHHPQFRLLEQLCETHGPLTRVSAAFSFPPFAEGNFRNDPRLGGGALADLGPYVAALARTWFGAQMLHCDCRILSVHPATGVETAFAVSLVFKGGRSLVGQFGFDTQYQNRINGCGPDWAFQLNRAFTTPPEFVNSLSVTIKGNARSIEVPAADAFTEYFAALTGSIQARDWRRYGQDMLADSLLRDSLERACRGESN